MRVVLSGDSHSTRARDDLDRDGDVAVLSVGPHDEWRGAPPGDLEDLLGEVVAHCRPAARVGVSPPGVDGERGTWRSDDDVAAWSTARRPVLETVGARVVDTPVLLCCSASPDDGTCLIGAADDVVLAAICGAVA